MQDELYLKDPAVIACVRGWSLLAEGYRLNVSLSLHAIQLVSNPSRHLVITSSHCWLMWGVKMWCSQPATLHTKWLECPPSEECSCSRK